MDDVSQVYILLTSALHLLTFFLKKKDFKAGNQ
jgi:hypothetical protein